MTKTSARPCIGIRCIHTVLVSCEITAPARPNGPPQGTMFITDAASATIVSSTYRDMCNAWYSGSSAGIVNRNVVEPEPSRCATTPIRPVPTATATTFPRVVLINARIIGVNKPTSCRMPKKMIAKMNITTTFITELRPSSKNVARSSKP